MNPASGTNSQKDARLMAEGVALLLVLIVITILALYSSGALTGGSILAL